MPYDLVEVTFIAFVQFTNNMGLITVLLRFEQAQAVKIMQFCFDIVTS